jgi:hypothetical protein
MVYRLPSNARINTSKQDGIFLVWNLDSRHILKVKLARTAQEALPCRNTQMGRFIMRLAKAKHVGLGRRCLVQPYGNQRGSRCGLKDRQRIPPRGRQQVCISDITGIRPSQRFPMPRQRRMRKQKGRIACFIDACFVAVRKPMKRLTNVRCQVIQ